MPVTLNQLNIDEVLRYMGCPPDRADLATRAEVEACAVQMLAAVSPRWTWRVFDLSFEAAGVRLNGGLLLPSRDLKKHLEGCRRAVLFCVTLGAQADALIRRTERLDMARALAMDCCATTAVEQVCDAVEVDLKNRFPDCFFPVRYSPGYGDLPLFLQNDLLDLLDAPRQVGLTASASHILIPRKSVTAILGVADQPIEKQKRSCLGCPAHDGCTYRKSGGHCGIS